MAFFKFRKGADESARAPAQPQSIEAIRQRAKYRLAGATVLVLAGVIGLPLLFDKQPRPIAVDTPIAVPDRNKVLPLVIPAAPVNPVVADKAPAQVSVLPPAATAEVKPAATPDKTSEENKAAAPVVKGEVATNSVVKEPAPPAKAAASVAARPEASRAQALLDGKDSPAKVTKAEPPKAAVAKPVVAEVTPAKPVAADSRFVVQVGAFADNARAHEVRLKLESAGLKTYAQAADTKDGKRIRVRLGPFATRAEADKVVEKVKKLNLPAALLTL